MVLIRLKIRLVDGRDTVINADNEVIFIIPCTLSPIEAAYFRLQSENFARKSRNLCKFPATISDSFSAANDTGSAAPSMAQNQQEEERLLW